MNKKILFGDSKSLHNLGIANIDDKYRITIETVDRIIHAQIEFTRDEMEKIHDWLGNLLDDNNDEN